MLQCLLQVYHCPSWQCFKRNDIQGEHGHHPLQRSFLLAPWHGTNSKRGEHSTGEHSTGEHTWNFPDLSSGASSDAPDPLLCNRNGLKGSKLVLLFMFVKSLTESVNPCRGSVGKRGVKLRVFTGIFLSCKWWQKIKHKGKTGPIIHAQTIQWEGVLQGQRCHNQSSLFNLFLNGNQRAHHLRHLSISSLKFSHPLNFWPAQI